MKKFGLAMLLGLLLAMVLAVTVAADFSIVSYDDTEATGHTPGTTGADQYIANGDFSSWTGGVPNAWNVPVPVINNEWEVHLAQTDLGSGGNSNYAAGMFFRAGSAGSQFAGMSQQVSPLLTTGTYWVQVHITAWQENTGDNYNSIAWYGFGSSSDPASVTEWRELFPDPQVCRNGNEICNYLGRAEAANVAAGSYMHVYMGMKFPEHNAWTVFVVDDISIMDYTAGVNAGIADFVDDGDVTWDRDAER